ncbi:MAG TPA: hypothetical protein EYN67_16820, partial [Flavobacteriales bacterium]|nr:hypothetical protein [Flavobacteriales bacterium]
MPRHTAKKRNQTKKTTKSRKNCVTKKQVKKIVKRQIAKTVDTLYLDHKMRPAIAPATNDITPWGVNSNLARGTVTGDTLPVNQLDNILKIGSALVPVGSSMRKGDEIFLKSIKVQLRLTAPVFSPAIAPNSTAINKVGQDMVAKV